MDMKYSADMVWKGPAFDRAQRDGARKGTRAAAEHLLSRAVPLAPKDTGALRSSGTVKGVNAEPIALVIFDTPYAVIQHEAEEYHHDDGQAKYLETPLQEEDAVMKQIIAQAIREAFAGA